MRRAAKVDANQGDIVEGLRDFGAVVHSCAALGKGFPDLLVGWRRINFLFEVKDGSLPPSGRSLTADQKRWHAEWGGTVHVVNSLDEAIFVLKNYRAP